MTDDLSFPDPKRKPFCEFCWVRFGFIHCMPLDADFLEKDTLAGVANHDLGAYLRYRFSAKPTPTPMTMAELMTVAELGE